MLDVDELMGWNCGVMEGIQHLRVVDQSRYGSWLDGIHIVFFLYVSPSSFDTPELYAHNYWWGIVQHGFFRSESFQVVESINQISLHSDSRPNSFSQFISDLISSLTGTLILLLYLPTARPITVLKYNYHGSILYEIVKICKSTSRI